MYTDMTYEKIIRRMLDAIPNTIDKRQGSVIYDAVAPAAAELTQMYIELDRILILAFASTSKGEYLERRASELGIDRKLATKAKRLGLFFDQANTPFDVPLGSRFSVDDVYYAVVERLNLGRYLLACDTAGEAGNIPEGRMIAVDYVPGLAIAELTEIIEPGTDTETDASLYNRYRIRARLPATSGNSYHYRQWALEVPGVGAAKVFPLWQGPGTVKVIVINQERTPAEPELVNAVYNHLETVRPIGAEVTVQSATAKSIDVAATVVLAPGYTIQGISSEFERQLEDYFTVIAFEETYISYAKLGSILLGVPGVIDHHDLLVNGGVSNVVLGDEDVPIVGTVELTL